MTAKAVAIEIANAVSTVINGATLTVDLTASIPKVAGSWPGSASVVRTYLAQYGRDDMAYARCTVLAADLDQKIITRGGKKQEEYGIDVIVQKRPTSDDDSDQLMLLTEQIADILAATDLNITGNTAYWIRQDRSPLYDAEDFDSIQQFTAPSRHIYRLYRA